MLEKLKTIFGSYEKMLLTAIAAYLLTMTHLGVEKIKFFATYPRENIALDSVQTKQIRAIMYNMSAYETKKESKRIDSIMLNKLDVIGKQQIVFQNSVISRYDDKVEMLTKNQREIIGVLKAMRLINIGYCDTTSMPAGITYTSE